MLLAKYPKVYETPSATTAKEKSVVAEDEERISTLQRVIGRIDEDMAKDRTTEDNFNRIPERSQGEQAVLKKRVMLNRQRLDEQAREQEGNTRRLGRGGRKEGEMVEYKYWVSEFILPLQKEGMLFLFYKSGANEKITTYDS